MGSRRLSWRPRRWSSSEAQARAVPWSRGREMRKQILLALVFGVSNAFVPYPLSRMPVSSKSYVSKIGAGSQANGEKRSSKEFRVDYDCYRLAGLAVYLSI